jgi:hypothetical protein
VIDVGTERADAEGDMDPKEPGVVDRARPFETAHEYLETVRVRNRVVPHGVHFPAADTSSHSSAG